VGDGLDLDEGARGQLGRLHRPARGRLGARVALVELGDLREVFHAGQEDGGLDQSIEPGAGRLENGREVREHLLRLLRDRRPHQRHFSSPEGDLSPDEDEIADRDGLEVRGVLQGSGGWDPPLSPGTGGERQSLEVRDRQGPSR
jgi:hypothetical protein